MPLKIAVVEDDAILREELSHFLRENQFEVFELVTGLGLSDLLKTTIPDLILLDLNLPGPNGFDIATDVKSRYSNIGIVMLTARTSLPDRIKSYDSGADIYLPKPTSSAEILAALNSLGRRINKELDNRDWVLHRATSTLQAPESSKIVFLTLIERDLLISLSQASEMIINADELCEQLGVTAHEYPITRRALENLISRLRKKISGDMAGIEPKFVIRSVRGIGYQLCITIRLA